jgi:hypothetical protein
MTKIAIWFLSETILGAIMAEHSKRQLIVLDLKKMFGLRDGPIKTHFTNTWRLRISGYNCALYHEERHRRQFLIA